MQNKLLPGTASIKLSVTEGVFDVSPSDIIRLKACSNYTCIYFTNRRPMLISKVLKEFQRVLDGYGFIRIHRTHLINRRYINCIGTDGKIVMSDQSVAGVSKRMKQQVMKQLAPAA
ncbi:MAG TPA: LytTR family DNA-binding domain-containing protein [Chitinophagaceae bacterium]|jgi:two-component system LytT family response regulator|nr:LytTR family DNA-binding domain-containing protein [Chitinophagaceae bacterium]